MKRLVVHLLAITTAALAFGGAAVAQEKPEFKLGFAALASRIPDVVGTPLEAEHHGSNGDSLQRTSAGLMVWRKADNWTAFTNGARTWIVGPLRLQERRNDERFDWEPEAALAMAASTATPTTAPSPTPTATPAPRPLLTSSQPNVIQGQGLEADSVWVLGEVRNDGTIPAYNVTVAARLLTDSGSVAGTASQAFAFLGPGDTVGYRTEVRGAPAYARAEVSVDSASSGFGGFARLSIAWVKNEQVADSRSDVRYEFTGTLGNSGAQPVSLSAIHVWFLEDQNRVVWGESSYLPNTLAPGDSYTFTVRTPRDGANPRVSDITQVRYYAAGRLP